MDNPLPVNISDCFQQLVEDPLDYRPVDWVFQGPDQLTQVILAIAHHKVGAKLPFFDFQ